MTYHSLPQLVEDLIQQTDLLLLWAIFLNTIINLWRWCIMVCRSFKPRFSIIISSFYTISDYSWNCFVFILFSMVICCFPCLLNIFRFHSSSQSRLLSKPSFDHFLDQIWLVVHQIFDQRSLNLIFDKLVFVGWLLFLRLAKHSNNAKFATISRMKAVLFSNKSRR